MGLNVHIGRYRATLPNVGATDTNYKAEGDRVVLFTRQY